MRVGYIAEVIRLIFIDVDGTLIGSSGIVPAAVWELAGRLRQRGVRLALASGRPGFGTTRDYAERLDATGWHVFQNGASVLHLPTRNSLSAQFPPSRVTRLVERARTTGRLLELYGDMDYAVEKDVPRARQHAELLGIPFSPRPFASLQSPIVRAQWLVDPPQVDAVLAEPHGDLEISPSTSPIMPDTIFINMTAPGVSKASAVRAIAAKYGIPLEFVMVVGEGGNDVEAMRGVGLPVAMGNAEPAAKAVARRQVGHVDAGGLAEALAMALDSLPGAR
jgi:Cof subfamily protein (haloacid dehalogenase superfamily)